MRARITASLFVMAVGGCSSAAAVNAPDATAPDAPVSDRPPMDLVLFIPDATAPDQLDAVADGHPAEATVSTDAPTDVPPDVPPDASSPSPCPVGSHLLTTAESACDGRATVPTLPTAALASALTAAPAGGVVDAPTLSVASLPCAHLAVCVPDDAPTLVFSDSPESPDRDGVLYADTFAPGRLRLYVYHANGGALPRRVSVVAYNPGPSEVTLTIRHRGVADASTDYVRAGRQALARYLADAAPVLKSVHPGARIVVSSNLDGVVTTRNQLAHAILDVETDATVTLSVVTVASTADTLTSFPSLSQLPADARHDRGTFPGADRLFVATAPLDGSSIVRVHLGSSPGDPPITGTDAVTGASRTLAGNYGVSYRFTLQYATAGVLAVAPRGGDWGGAVLSGGVITQLPTVPSAITASPARLGVVGATPATGEGAMTVFTAGGSSLPVEVLFAPVP